MTRPVHLFLKKKSENTGQVTYMAVSRDFSGDSSLQAIAEIYIDKKVGRYEFVETGAWSGEKVLPPHFYETPESESSARYHREYPDYKYGAWTARIHAWVTRLIQEGVYPEEAPMPLKNS